MSTEDKLRRALEAAKMARTRLDRFADEANAGRVHYDARELKRKIGAAFTDFDEALAATQEQPDTSLIDGVIGYAKANAEAARTLDERQTWEAHRRNCIAVRDQIVAVSSSERDAQNG